MKLKSICFAALGVIAMGSLSAQVTVDNTITAEDLVNNYLLGEGVVASNITFNGQPASELNVQIGLYDGPSNYVSFDQGIVMATYDVVNVAGGFGGGLTNSITNDQDLLDLSGQPNMNDCAILEFDFIATSDSIRFNYVFASNEYPNYTCTQFNDAFGFFLSGPGISGPYSNGSINMALVPNSDIPVAINTINGGVPTGSGTVENCENANPNWVEDSQYFVDNNPTEVGDVQFPGMTVTLVAEAEVQCGGEYHIKMAIGDAIDGGLDSGVFIEAGSFAAFGDVLVNVSPDIGGVTVTDPQYSDVVVAGCSNFGIEIVRPEGTTVDSVYVDFGGTAQEGQDYILTGNDSLFVFSDGIDTLNYSIETLYDGTPDEDEYLTIEIFWYNGCGDLQSSSDSIFMVDPYVLDLAVSDDEVLYCPTSTALLEAEGSNGIEPYTYTWSWIDNDGNVQTATGSNYTVVIPPDDETYYTVSVTDPCGFEPYTMDSILVTNSIPEPLEGIIADFAQPTCPNEPITFVADAANGTPPYSYVWEKNFAVEGNDQTFEDVDFFDHSINLRVTDECGETVRDTVQVVYPAYEPMVAWMEPLEDNCPEGPIPLQAFSSGGAGETEYTWSQTLGEGEFVLPPVSASSSIALSGGVNVVQIQATDRCHRLGLINPLVPGQATGTDTLLVINIDKLQNILTPNGDGKNDVFVIEGAHAFDAAQLIVYDRWGTIVYETDNYEVGLPDASLTYDNPFDGKDLEDGTYFYVISIDNGDCTESGSLEIISADN